MVDISRIDIKEDYLQKKLNSLCHLFGWNLNDGVRVLFNGKESFLFYCNNIFVRYFISADMEMMYDIIQVDDEGKVVTFTLKIDDDDYQVVIDENGVKLIDENKNQRFLRLVKDNYSSDDISNNGVLGFGQYNIKNNILLEMRYEQMVHGSLDNKIIYSDYIKEPYSYSFEYGLRMNKLLSFIRRKKTFYRLDFDFRDNRWQYELENLKELGINAYRRNGTSTLHFSRYYRELFHIGDYITITGFPFLRGYTEDEIRNLVYDNDFLGNIPDYLISIFNKRISMIREYQDIVDAYNNFMLNDKSLSKKIGDEYDKS